MAPMRLRTASRGARSPASIMPSIAASIAAAFIFMKSVSVLSRSKTMARIKPALRPLLAREADAAAQADLAVVDPKVEPAARIAAHPGLVGDGRSVAAVIGERKQNAIVALSALGKLDFHPRPLPPEPQVPSPVDPILGEPRGGVSIRLAGHFAGGVKRSPAIHRERP